MSLLTNWKTTVAGVFTILAGIAGLLGIKGGVIDPATAAGMIATGVGLIFASDAPKS